MALFELLLYHHIGS